MHEDQFLCVEFHQFALYQRADLYRQKFGSWPTNVQALVAANLFPAISQAHMCPSAIRFCGSRENLQVGKVGWISFVDDKQSGVMTHYTHSPYRFKIESTNFSVTCNFDKSHSPENVWPNGQMGQSHPRP